MIFKRIIPMLLIMLCFCTYTASAVAENMCGESATYTLNDSILTINGSGVVNDDTGWIEYYSTIDTVIISEGITKLDSRLFDGFEILSSVSLPNTLTAIGIRTFRDCINLNKIVIPDSVTSINANSFDGCDNLVIYCSAGSYAEQYAKINSYPYKTVNSIKISFDANGGTGAPNDIIGSISQDFIVPIQKPSKTDYIFVGWSTTPTASAATYSVGDKIDAMEDITLYAVWLQCSISDKSTENKIIIESTTTSPNIKLWIAAYKEKRMVEIKQKDIQLFSGKNEIETETAWDDIERDEVKVFLWDENLMPYTNTKNVHLSKPNTVTFIDWNGDIIDAQTVLSGNDATLPVAPTRPGYEFCGWSGSYQSIFSDTTVLAQYIDATKENVFKVFSARANKNNYVTISVYLGGIVDMSGFDMNLHYDKDVLEVSNINSNFNLDVVANHIEKDNRIRFNYSSNKNRAKSAKIMEIEFKIKNTEKTNTLIELKPASVVKIDSSQDKTPIDADYNIDNGVIIIN